MFAISIAGNSWAHRRPVGQKMLFLALASLCLFWIQSWGLMLIAVIAVLVLYLSVGSKALVEGLKLLYPLLWILVIIFAFHIFRRDIAMGAVVCMRLLALMSLANLVTLTSKLSDMTDLFLWVLSPLERIGLRTASIALALGMVMRFTPVLIERANQLSESWRARGGKRTSWRLILPLFITVVDDADRVAEALSARGGVGNKNGT